MHRVGLQTVLRVDTNSRNHALDNWLPFRTLSKLRRLERFHSVVKVVSARTREIRSCSELASRGSIPVSDKRLEIDLSRRHEPNRQLVVSRLLL